MTLRNFHQTNFRSKNSSKFSEVTHIFKKIKEKKTKVKVIKLSS